MGQHTTQQVVHVAKTAGDTGAISALVAAWMGFLPHLATLLTVVWMAIRIWETDTIQRWREKRSKLRRARKRT